MTTTAEAAKAPAVAVTFKAEIEVSAQKVTDQIISAFEGGSNYWIDKVTAKKGRELATERPWYADPKVWSSDFLIEVLAEEDSRVHLLTPAKINEGFAYLSTKYPSRIAEIVEENGDAETGDVFLQACLFGDIVYG
ncbi:hypothetical protein QA639_21140 [Bradyrhizobium pachyrhizi]|uniref:hypothetical protein n=1 Tax=Bradyrhizobium pachyrhizi TaxID=280333 RepID=UPI0024B15A97|nr:hypothetical protein [Bradyrhizobium pachyrhizi]WFU52215.1 hypothetical protein QA639_21140 [Bradyrhizobium pachyrhizi]